MQVPRCTPEYAPPEVLSALLQQRFVTVSAAHDMWALGVLGFETTVREQRMSVSGNEAVTHALEGTSYPWERGSDDQPRAWQHSRLRTLLLPCLARDPAKRPTAAELVGHIDSISQHV